MGDVGKINITPTVDLKDVNAKIKSVSGTINVPVTPVVDTQGVLSTVRSALGSAQISLNVPLSPVVNASEFNNAVKNSVAGLSALQFPIRLGVDQTFFSESVKRAIAAAGKLKLNVDVDAKGIESLTALAKAQTEMLKEQNRGRKLALETDPNSASSIRARASLLNAQTMRRQKKNVQEHCLILPRQQRCWNPLCRHRNSIQKDSCGICASQSNRCVTSQSSPQHISESTEC